MYFATDVEDNLPAAHAVNTESPPASEIIRLHGTPERSNSPDTTKYVRAKSTVVRQIEFSSAPFNGYTPGSTFIGFCGSVNTFCLKPNNGNASA